MTMNTPTEQDQDQSHETRALLENLWEAYQGSIHSQDGRFVNDTWEIKKLKPQPKEESSLLDTINGAIRWLKLAKSVVPMMQSEENIKTTLPTATTNNLPSEDDNAEDEKTTAATDTLAENVDDYRIFIGIKATYHPYSDDSNVDVSEKVQTIEKNLRYLENRRPSSVSDSTKSTRSLLSLVDYELQDISGVQSDIIGGVNVRDLDDGLVLDMSTGALPDSAADDKGELSEGESGDEDDGEE